MSVLATKRAESELQVLTFAYNLTLYTLKKVKNEKYYPKNQRWVLANRTSNCALDVLLNIQSANETPTLTANDLRIRREFQIKAHTELQSLMQLIRLAGDMYTLNADSMEYWTKLADDTDIKLRAWMKSDKERFN